MSGATPLLQGPARVQYSDPAVLRQVLPLHDTSAPRFPVICRKTSHQRDRPYPVPTLDGFDCAGAGGRKTAVFPSVDPLPQYSKNQRPQSCRAVRDSRRSSETTNSNMGIGSLRGSGTISFASSPIVDAFFQIECQAPQFVAMLVWFTPKAAAIFNVG